LSIWIVKLYYEIPTSLAESEMWGHSFCRSSQRRALRGWPN